MAQSTGTRQRRGPHAPAQPTRRQFSARYKIDILAEYDTLDRRGRTALLRRENLTASTVSRWRALVYEAALHRLAAEPGSQPGHTIHASASLWDQFRQAAAASDPPFKPEQLIRAFMRYHAGLTDYLPPRPDPQVAPRSQ